ncbi:MAG: hypothetical protein KF764_00685 [Labilithrix sp.]|nr:hypothetical protein [Labilithrix sp.]
MKSRFALSTIALSLVLAGCSGSAAGGDVDGPGGSSSGGSSSGGGASSGSGDGSGSGSEHDALFDAPSESAVTAGSIFGLWGGATKDLSFTFDSRMRLGQSTMTFATRCVRDNGDESAVVGVTVAARVDESEISVLESKKDEKKTGDITCRANARPGTTKRCDTDEGFRRACFVLDGTELTIYGMSSLDKVVLTKISD